MEFEKYQMESRKSAVYAQDNKVIRVALGLSAECGEVVEQIRNRYNINADYQNIEFKKRIKKELGDLLWYFSNLCSDMSMSMEEIAEDNLKRINETLK
jgi:NTP pyrophosphatase (non-canonical NTP hydrolase)